MFSRFLQVMKSMFLASRIHYATYYLVGLIRILEAHG